MNEAITKYVEAYRDVKRLEAELDEAKTRRKEALDPALDAMMDSDPPMQSFRTDTGATFYIAEQIMAAKQDEAMDPEVLAAAVEDMGFGEFAPKRVNWQGLSAMVRERVKGERDNQNPDAFDAGVPEPLRGLIKATSKFDIRARGL